MSVFDIYGKLVPALSTLKADVRICVKETNGWEMPVSPELRTKWIENFWRLEKLKGMQFSRPILTKTQSTRN